MNLKPLYKGLATILGATALYGSFFVVDQTQQAVVTQFGNPVRAIINPIVDDEKKEKKLKESYEKQGITFSKGPGLKFKLPFIQKVERFDRRIMFWAGYPEEITTKDKKYIWVDSMSPFYIEDPVEFLRKVRTLTAAHGRLDDMVEPTIREGVTSNSLAEIVRNSDRKLEFSEEELQGSSKSETEKVQKGRERIVAEMYAKAAKDCEQYGLRIVDVQLTGLNYVSSVKESIEANMKAERQRIAEKYKSEGRGNQKDIEGQKELDLKDINSTAYRTAQGIRGVADASAIRIYAGAYEKDPEFFQFLRSLEVYRRLEGSTLIIGMDNDLMRYFKSPKGSKK